MGKINKQNKDIKELFSKLKKAENDDYSGLHQRRNWFLRLLNSFVKTVFFFRRKND